MHAGISVVELDVAKLIESLVVFIRDVLFFPELIVCLERRERCWLLSACCNTITYISEGSACHCEFERLITDAGRVFLLFCSV